MEVDTIVVTHIPKVYPTWLTTVIIRVHIVGLAIRGNYIIVIIIVNQSFIIYIYIFMQNVVFVALYMFIILLFRSVDQGLVWAPALEGSPVETRSARRMTIAHLVHLVLQIIEEIRPGKLNIIFIYMKQVIDYSWMMKSVFKD